MSPRFCLLIASLLLGLLTIYVVRDKSTHAVTKAIANTETMPTLHYVPDGASTTAGR